MLGAFGLKITLDENKQKLLSELSELRNVILHHGGFVDQKFKEKCPWRNEMVGDRINIDSELLGLYFDAASEFAKKLMQEAAKSSYIKTVEMVEERIIGSDT